MARPREWDRGNPPPERLDPPTEGPRSSQDWRLDPVILEHDELDAVTAALTGYFYLAGAFEAVGHAAESFLIIPVPGNGRKRFGSKRKL